MSLEPELERSGLAEFGVGTVDKFLSFFLLGEDGLAAALKKGAKTFAEAGGEDAYFGDPTAASAEEGLRAFKDIGPDLIIVDLMMEEVDAGTGFARELQILQNRAPVFMLSSIGDNLNITTDYNSLGLAGVFQKPLAKETLLSVLRAKLPEKA